MESNFSHSSLHSSSTTGVGAILGSSDGLYGVSTAGRSRSMLAAEDRKLGTKENKLFKQEAETWKAEIKVDREPELCDKNQLLSRTQETYEASFLDDLKLFRGKLGKSRSGASSKEALL